MTDDMVHINAGVAMRSNANAEVREIVEIPRAEWDALTSEEQEARLDCAADLESAITTALLGEEPPDA